ncbi:MobF family relaxase [Massilia sp. YIM B02769]|uniref:MobF family relaxase n=1 Tax=Massilia sp. YIM B02769 TaxID=3050129 RepID=UPI0025B70FC4|nr:MobF family relaxase [Massilia sp. YIM B02769]MDN4061242.1 MobF family relaxase [Massilia sp. YIM B02769]
MLTLAKVTPAESAASYYEESDDYYGEGGRAPSQWWGTGAATLGLEGVVDAEAFKALLAGALPDGEAMHRGGDGVRTAGLDLTFSAPKSVSMQALIGGDERLLDAHQAAVSATLRYVQANLAAYRSTQDGETVTVHSGNLAVARFEHDLSRDADPQVHTHSVVLNMTQRDDGQWRALDGRPLYEHQKLLGVLYRAELARAIQALGYRVRRTHQDGRFELAHITDRQVAAFSTRSRAIDAALAARGKDRASASADEREIAGLSTRRSKDRSIDRVALREVWLAKAVELGIDWSAMQPPLVPQADLAAAARNAVDFAVAHLTERSAIVQRIAVAHAALAHGTGTVVLDDVQLDIDQRLRSGELLAPADGRRITTPAAQAAERELLAIEARGRSALTRAIWQPTQGDLFAAGLAAVASRPALQESLTEGQRRAAELILTTHSRIVGVQGLAGTGKTSMLRTVSDNLGPEFRALGLAPSAAAARELEKSGFEAMTIAGFLAKGRPLDDRTIVVVDEAGMVSLRDMHALLSIIEQADARAVLVGDTGQLKAVEAGIPFRQLQEQGMPTVRMADILRQQNKNLRAAVVDAAEGRVGASLAKLAATVAEVPHATERYQKIARDYACHLPEDRAKMLVVAGTNRARRSINEMVRQRLGLASTGVVVSVIESRDLTRAQLQSSLSYSPGDIIEAQRHYDSIGLRRGDTAVVAEVEPGCITLRRASGDLVKWRPTAMPHVAVHSLEAREVAVGDRLRFTANDYRWDIVNGQTGIVAAIDESARELMVRVDSGRTLKLDLDQPLKLDHAYCTTVHAAQGQTCDRVLVEADVSSAMANHSLYYVAISRARHGVTIYTDDRELLPQAMSRLDVKHAALDLERTSRRGLAL